MADKTARVDIEAGVSGKKDVDGLTDSVYKMDQAIIDLNTALLNSSKHTKSWQRNLLDTFDKIKSAAPEKRLALLRKEGTKLGKSQQEMYAEILRAGVSIEKLAEVMGRSQKEIIKLAGAGEKKFIKVMHEAGTSTEELASILNKTNEQIERTVREFEKLATVADPATEALHEQLEAMAELGEASRQRRQLVIGDREATAKAFEDQIAAIREYAREQREAYVPVRQRIGEIATVSQEQVSIIDRIRNALNNLTSSQQQSTTETEKSGQSWTAWAKKLLLWGIGAASAFRAYMTLRRAIEEGFRDVYQNTEQYKKFQDAVEKARNSFVLLIIPQETVLGLLDDMADKLDTLGDGFIQMRAAIDGWASSISSAEDRLWSLMNLSIAIQERGGLQQFIGEATLGGGAQFGEAVGERYAQLELERIERQGKLKQAIDKQNQSLAKNIELLEQSTTGESDRERKTSTLVDTIRRLRDATEEYTLSLAEANKEAAENIVELVQDWSDEIIEINEDYEDEVEDIHAKYDKQREKAEQDKLARERAAIERNQDAIKKAIEQHNLEMLHMQQRFDLTMLQNQRLYEAERRWLVAEGDTLGIERLDERYELERQINEENYNLQRKQQEEMFQLQLKFMKQAAEIQARELANALAERIGEIERARQEELAEAEKARQEEIAETNKANMERLRDEEDAAEERRAQALENYERDKEALAQHLVDLGLEWGYGKEKIQQLAIDLTKDLLNKEELGEFKELVSDTFDETVADTKTVTDALQGLVDRLGNTAGESIRTARDAMSAGKDAWISDLSDIRSNTDRTTMSILAMAAAAMQARAAMASIPTGPGGRLGSLRQALVGRGTRGYQYGGSFMTTEPTLWRSSENYSPELITVKPLSVTGGGMFTHRWDGGAIPVEGRGAMSGADMHAVARAMAKSLMMELTTVATRMRGQRG